jgi:hypothetical protein
MANPAIHALAFASGVALHALWFNGREHHFYGWGYIFTTLLTFISGMLVLSRGYGFPFGQAVTSSFSLVSTVLGGIYSSLAVYRLFLNPLNRFPGPYWTRLGNIAWSAQLGKADGYQKLKALHDKHGDIVRIGSHDLSIVDPEGMQITYGIGVLGTKATRHATPCTPHGRRSFTTNAVESGPLHSRTRLSGNTSRHSITSTTRS